MRIQHGYFRDCLERSSDDLVGPSGCCGGAHIRDGLYIAGPVDTTNWSMLCQRNVVWRSSEVT